MLHGEHAWNLAKRLAKEEREDYETALTGVYGEELKARAQKLGLGPISGEDGKRRAIVEIAEEKKDGWHCTCLVTDEHFVRPIKEPKKSGWKSW